MPGRLEPLEPWLPPRLVQLLRQAAQRWRDRRQQREGESLPTFGLEEVDAITELFCTVGTARGGPWDRLRDAHLPLPAWFRTGLDPWSDEYRAQQERLWQQITGVERPYAPDDDETEVYAPGLDAIRQPAYYMRRDVEAISSASDHVLATGMLLKHCGLVAGDTALEYGAGFAQTALALARLGVRVDTVDISPAFCGWVREQAEFFRVPLTPHHGHFGLNPRPGHRYRLIWFYESFHHCWDFERVVPLLAGMLAEGGRVILGGEPVFERPNAAVPYPWGVRLHSEVVAVMRRTRWMELGFTEAFLYELFARSGFRGSRVECGSSDFGRLYVFERPLRRRPERVSHRWGADDAWPSSPVGVREGAAIVTDGRAGYLVQGRYVPAAAGDWWLEVRLTAAPRPSGRLWVDVVSSGGRRLHGGRWFDLADAHEGSLWLAFTLPASVPDLEIRVVVAPDTVAGIEAVGLAEQPA